MNINILNNLEGALNNNIALHKKTIENIANINSENFSKNFATTLNEEQLKLARQSALDEELNNMKATKIEALMRIWTLRYQDLRKVVSLGKG